MKQGGLREMDDPGTYQGAIEIFRTVNCVSERENLMGDSKMIRVMENNDLI